MNSEIIASTWRTGVLGGYGIVAVKRADGWKAYLGSAGGVSVERDEHAIATLGAPLMEPEARAFFPALKDEPYDY